MSTATVRMVAVAVLGTMLVAAAVAGFLLLGRAEVRGDTPEQRVRSIMRLADRRPYGAVGAIAGATSDASPEVRAAAVLALGGFGDVEHLPLVREALDDPAPGVRAAGAETLGRYDADDVPRRLAQVLDEDPAERVRLAAVRGLARQDRSEAVVALVAAMEDNRMASVRLRAMEALMNRIGISFAHHPDPHRGEWARRVRTVRWQPLVQRALAAVDRKER